MWIEVKMGNGKNWRWTEDGEWKGVGRRSRRLEAGDERESTKREE